MSKIAGSVVQSVGTFARNDGMIEEDFAETVVIIVGLFGPIDALTEGVSEAIDVITDGTVEEGTVTTDVGIGTGVSFLRQRCCSTTATDIQCIHAAHGIAGDSIMEKPIADFATSIPIGAG